MLLGDPTIEIEPTDVWTASSKPRDTDDAIFSMLEPEKPEDEKPDVQAASDDIGLGFNVATPTPTPTPTLIVLIKT